MMRFYNNNSDSIIVIASAAIRTENSRVHIDQVRRLRHDLRDIGIKVLNLISTDSLQNDVQFQSQSGYVRIQLIVDV